VAAAAGLFASFIIMPSGHADEGSAITFPAIGVPAAPSEVKATLTDDGIRVRWTVDTASQPEVTHAIVDAGPGSCPVTVPAAHGTALVPLPEEPGIVRPRVRLVNPLGISKAKSSLRGVRTPQVGASQFEPLQILSITDLHGALEARGRSMGVARLASAFAQDRLLASATITVSAGDNFGKSPLISSLLEERPTVEALNLMGLDVSTFGNHEHDRPLSHVQSMVEASDFTWTVANYSALEPVSGPTNAVQPHVLLERSGLTIGVVGMNVARLRSYISADNLLVGYGQRLEVSASTSAAIREAQLAREAGADAVILLVHEGWNKNVGDRPAGGLIRVAQEVQGEFDAVFGGHTHRAFSAMVGDTLVVQTTSHGRMYGRTTLCIDTSTGTVVGASTEAVRSRKVRDLPEDAGLAAFVRQAAERRDIELDRVIGSVDRREQQGDPSLLARTADAALGNFVTDLLRREYGTDLALLNAATFMDGLPAASFESNNPQLQRPGDGSTGPFDITVGDVTAALSPHRIIVRTSITATNLRTLIERGLKNYPNNPDFLQISGLRIEFDPSLPEGSRIVGMWDEYGSAVTDGGRTFTVATAGHLATGKGRDARLFERRRTVLRPYFTSVTEALERDLRMGRVTPVPPADGRIHVLDGQATGP
jgi:2',3'-cyclic-nucleotide 2'-phosphodiesterase (5'-nucleotidase family)